MGDEEKWEKRAKRLVQVLILSGSLNIGLLGTFFYFALREKDRVPLVARDEVQTELVRIHNCELLAAYSILSLPELLVRLEDRELVEEGYTRRDLALASLVAFHHFNLESAIHGQPLQKRRMGFLSPDGKEEVCLTVFPGLLDYQFEAILQYARTEKWPLQPEGLFLEIRQSHPPYDPTLLEAFWLTPEFHILETLFNRTNPELSKEGLLELVTEGEWQVISAFAKRRAVNKEQAFQIRNELLTQYLHGRSKSAARLLLNSDMEYVLRRLDDHQITLLLDLIPERTKEFEALIRSLLTCKRSDEVWKKAAGKLYGWLGEPLPEPYDHLLVLTRFFPEQVAKKPVQEKVENPQVKKKRIHIVRERDSLWKISRKYKVSIDELKKINHLETDRLKPDQELEIP